MSKLNNNNTNNVDHNSANNPIEMDKIEIVVTPENNPRSRSRSRSRVRRDLASTGDDDHLLHRRSPIPRPKFVDDDELDSDYPKTHQPGVDNGFFYEETDEIPEDNFRKRRPSYTPSNFPYSPGYGPVDINVTNKSVPDVNVYQQKKTLAQGMMDLALLSANANQLRYVLESYHRHPYYYPSLVFISMSLILQVAVGIGLIINSKYNVKDQNEMWKANQINNFTVIGIFMVAVVNVFISAFGIAEAA